MRPARPAVVFAAGYFALTAQALLFREHLTAFEGNELAVGIFFGSWLVWVAVGAVAGRLASGLWRHFELAMLLYLPAFALQLYLTAGARSLLGVESYELFPLGGMLALSLVTNAPVSAVTGALFVLACRWWAEGGRGEARAPSLPVARVYVLETLGALAGGVAVTLLLSGGVRPETIALLAATVVALAITIARPRSLLRLAVAVALLVALAGGAGAPWGEARNRAQWARLLDRAGYAGSFTTQQAKYLHGESGGQFVVVSGGSVVEAPFNRIDAREVLAVLLCQRPDAREVLVVGPGSLPICLTLLELPQMEGVTWLHPDPHYPRELLAVLAEMPLAMPGSLRAPGTDVRRYLRETTRRHDLVILNLPAVTTLVANRSVTRELFELLKGVLVEDGVVALRFPGAENFMGEELALVGSSARATLEAVFSRLVLKPGGESWWIASERAELSESPALLRDRFASIDGAAAILPPAALPSLYAPDRIAFQRVKYDEIEEAFGRGLLVNRDRAPKALLFGLLATLRRAGVRALRGDLTVLLEGGLWMCVLALLLHALARSIYLWTSPRSAAAASLFDSYFLVLSTGLAGMALSVILMFSYQSHFGSLYLHVGLIAALFMLGTFLGSAASERLLAGREEEPRLLCPALLVAQVVAIAAAAVWLAEPSQLLYALLFALSGFFTGAYFPIAAHRMARAGRRVAASAWLLDLLDHTGGALGAVVTGLFTLPVLGERAALGILALLVGVNLVPALIPGLRAHRARDRFELMARPAGYALVTIALFLLGASQISASLRAQREGQELAAAARSMTGGVELTESQAHLSSGATLPYFEVAATDELPGGVLFGTAQLAEGVRGYGGPIILALFAEPDGKLRDFRILRSKETPAYLDALHSWNETLLGRNLFAKDPFQGVDAVSGATVSSAAILETLETAGRGFAVEVLGKDVESPEPRAGPDSPDRELLWLSVVLVASVALRFRPGRWRRRLLLLASVVVLGFLLNAQYSTQHLFTLIALSPPEPGLTVTFFMVVLIPVVVLLFGNIYCGSVCPFGALQELVGDLRPASLDTDPEPRVWRYGRAVKYLLLVLLAALFAVTRDPAVLSADPLSTIFSVVRSPSTVFLAVVVIALSFVYRRFWCRNLCPAGAFLALLNRFILLGRFLPPSRPGHCDLGLGSARELDCLRCDRCWHEKD